MQKINRLMLIGLGGEFPDPRFAPADEPLALGFELTPELMLKGYAQGIFAWTVNPVTWWSPDPRAIFDLDGLHVSRRLARKIRQKCLHVTLNFAFLDVVLECGKPRYPGDETWITRDFVVAYQELHRRGYAHSVECWQGEQLVGGVFGVAIGGFFAAESMFYRVTDASKIALFYLVETLRQQEFLLLDIQVLIPHTESLGARNISREAYLELLGAATRQPVAQLEKRILA
jgi:leucyl/phenylalanyl-tRNA---protein transferase